MKKNTFKTVKALAAFLVFTALVSTSVNGQTSDVTARDIMTSVKVKEFSGNNVSLDLTAFNATKVPYQLFIRDADGTIIYREAIQDQQYDKRFNLNLEEFETFSIEIVQGKKATDVKTIKVTRRIEEKVDVLSIQ
jgi:ABC-type uncharacterized transport system involved in gliding motility auxiliary subunit